jgi:hypothetical protein
MAFYDVFYNIFFHGYPEICRRLYLPGHHMSINISFTNAFVNFLESFFYFSPSQTSQQCSIGRPFI